MLEKMFQEAVENPEIRQKFLDSIDLEDAKPYVDRIIYSPFCGFIHPMGLMFCKFSLMAHFNKKGYKSRVFVMPRSFSPVHENVDDFLSSLIDHEGYHARELFLEPLESRMTLSDLIGASFTKEKRLNWNIKHTAIEQSATYNQILNLTKRDCSESYVQSLYRRHKIYKEILERNSRRLDNLRFNQS